MNADAESTGAFKKVFAEGCFCRLVFATYLFIYLPLLYPCLFFCFVIQDIHHRVLIYDYLSRSHGLLAVQGADTFSNGMFMISASRTKARFYWTCFQ